MLTAWLGDSKFGNNYQIIGEFKVHHNLMLDCYIRYQYGEVSEHISTKIAGMRVMGQMVAGVLFLVFVFRMLQVRDRVKELIVKGGEESANERAALVKYRNWYVFLAGCNLILMASSIWAPLCAWLQFLPLF